MTVGIDIGSTTSHVMFARLRMQRLADALSSRYVVAERTVLHRSPILLTPFRSDGLIDTAALEPFVNEAYHAAHLGHDDVDTGAVILTGAALERPNAKAIDELFAAHGGKFVCATAGHRLEAILAGHGSGAVARSRGRDSVILNIDVGGGTTKLALCVRGAIQGASAIRVGARHATAPRGRGPGLASEASVVEMADAIVAAARGEATSFDLLAPIASAPRPDEIVLSGGVSEHYFGRDLVDHGDRGVELAKAIAERRGSFGVPITAGDEGIRATVVGASQFSMQLSGSTIFVSPDAKLPLRNVPVVRAADASSLRRAVAESDRGAGALALAIPWRGEPAYAAIRGLAEAVRDASDGHRPLVVALDGDVAHTLGAILIDELGVPGPLVIVDGLDLRELDYVDIGEVVRPAGVVPVVIKSLVFGSD